MSNVMVSCFPFVIRPHPIPSSLSLVPRYCSSIVPIEIHARSRTRSCASANPPIPIGPSHLLQQYTRSDFMILHL